MVPQFSRTVRRFRHDQAGGLLVFWGLALVLFLGFVGMIFDVGRMGTTQAELQSFADSVSLAAAAELDGRADSLTRAEAAAATLITDTQTFAKGSRTLTVGDDVVLTYYRPDPSGHFSRSAALQTTNPYQARYAEARVTDRSIALGFSAAFAALRGTPIDKTSVGADAVAEFSLEACNVAPVAVCLPSVDFDAQAAIGKTLDLHTSVTIGALGPGNIAAVDTVTEALSGLQVCAGLSGGALDACLIAARKPESACTGRGGLKISADVTGTGLIDSINTRLGLYGGVASGLANNANFAGAPNLLAGLTSIAGLCLPLPSLSAASDIGLPKDDCLASGTCSVMGNGTWTQGRAAYVNAHYNGVDPHPTATTRFDYYKAEIAASANVTSGGTGGLLSSFVPQLCAPPTPADPKRRLMVVAGIDCSSTPVDGTTANPPVRAYFEAFVLGPGRNGALSVEISACLGGSCGGGHLNADVHDVVRLVQ